MFLDRHVRKAKEITDAIIMGEEWTRWPVGIPSTMKFQVNLETC